MKRLGSDPLALAAAFLLAVFGFLPIVNWIPGGRSVGWFGDVAGGWVSGTAIVAGIAIVLTIVSRRSGLVWRDGLLDATIRRWSGIGGLCAVAALALVCYGLIARFVFGGRPLVIDEIVQMLQAQILAGGRLWSRSPPHPEFSTSLLMVNAGGKVYAQFPFGGPAMLALGELAGVPWLVGPICGAASVFLFGYLLRLMRLRPGLVLGATLLFALAPFTAFMAGTYMNHVPALMWLLVGTVGLAHVVSSDRGRVPAALISGIGFGCAATIRPLDAVAFALPAGLWYLWRAIRSGIASRPCSPQASAWRSRCPSCSGSTSRRPARRSTSATRFSGERM